MSMLPDVLTVDECDLVHEDAFFQELHLMGDVDEETVMAEAIDVSTSIPELIGRWGDTVRVRGRNYSYPLKFDPLFSKGEMYAGCNLELY